MLRSHSKGALSEATIGNPGLSAMLALGVLLTLASEVSGKTPATGPVEPNLQITVRVYNYSGTSRGTLLRAEEEGSRIFGEAGVELVWLDCPTSHAEENKYPACAAPLGAMAVDLRLLPPFMADRLKSNRNEMGLALPCAQPGSASAAWVFYQRVAEVAESRLASQSQVLGHAMAHEIGHLLLGPDHHSRGGIMRANWDQRYLEDASRGQLLFTRDQAELIRAEVQTRSGMMQLHMASQPAPRDLTAKAGR